jgi:two-component system, response regulator
MTESSVVDILLVEDSPADVELTVRALRKANIANPVHVVSDGAAAIEYLLGGDGEEGRVGVLPRLILLDLKLPKVDGLEVLRRVKADERARTVPVVVLTSSREEQDLVRSYHLGANSYIVKPVDFEKFVEAVAQVGMYWLLLNQSPDASLRK